MPRRFDLRLPIFLAKRAVFSSRSVAAYRELVANESLSPDRLADLNWQRRRALVEYVFANNTFYRRKYREVGYAPGDLRTPEDFATLPILEKEDIRNHVDDLISRGHTPGSLRAATTGGTTGAPLKTYRDPTAPDVEISWRTLAWWGVGPADNSGYLYRAIPSSPGRALQSLLLWPTQRAWISAARMDEKGMEAFYRRLCRLRPTYLVGYVGAIDIFVRFLERRVLTVDGLNAVWTTSSPLTMAQRQLFGQVLRAPVYTQYGSCEFYWIAAECARRDGMHVANDCRHVEIVDNGRTVPAGEFGDLVVTDLANRAFPLIRYRLGDRGRLLPQPCTCGRPFPLMDYVRGRITDTIRLPDGAAIPGEYWTTIFDEQAEIIRAFQIHQSADYSLRVLYEPFPGAPHEAAVARVRRTLEDKLQDAIPVTFTSGIVSTNEPAKARFVVSDVVDTTD